MAESSARQDHDLIADRPGILHADLQAMVLLETGLGGQPGSEPCTLP